MNFKALTKEIVSATGWMQLIAWLCMIASVMGTIITLGLGAVYFGLTFTSGLRLKKAADTFSKLSNASTDVDSALLFHEALGHLKSSFLFMGCSIIIGFSVGFLILLIGLF